ncbi:MAG: efflux RND transporter permease subunit, partial [Flavobacteriales bacterium]
MNYRLLAKKVLLGILGITILCGFLISELGFDYNFENFFPAGDTETEFFQSYRYDFETDNDFIIIGIKDEKSIFQSPLLEKIDLLVDSLEAMPYVVEVASPTRFKDVIIDPLTGRPFDKDLLRWSKPELLSKDSATVFRHGEMVGTFFSEDGKSLAIQVKHKEFLSKRGCDSLAVNSQKLVDSFGFSETHLVGRSIGQAYYVDMMQRELVVFISISILLIILFLFIAFRSWWGIWVPVTVVLLSVVWILGIMKLCGKDIDLMLMVLPTIIFVVGMSDVVHVLTKYFDELRSGKEKIEAIKIAFKEIGMATFLTSLTTAVGFLTLLTSSIIPIKEFGIYTAVGVFVAFILAYSLLPAVLVLSRKPNLDNNDDRKSNFWAQQMRRWFVFTMKNRKSLLGAFGLLLVFSLIGLSKVQVNNFILEDLKDSDFLKQEFV